MLGTGIDLELFRHGVAQRTLGQHALDGLFQRAARKTLLHFLEVGLGDPARIGRVTVVAFESGRAHVGTPVTNAHIVCSLMIEKKKCRKYTEIVETETYY